MWSLTTGAMLSTSLPPSNHYATTFFSISVYTSIATGRRSRPVGQGVSITPLQLLRI